MTVFVHFRGMKTANRRMCTRGADVFGFVHTVRTNVRDAILCGQPPSGAREARERCAASGRQPIPRHSLHGAHELRKQYAVSGLGISPLASGGNDFQKDRHPLRWFLSSWDSIFRPFGDTSAHGTALPFLFELGTEIRNGSTVTIS